MLFQKNISDITPSEKVSFISKFVREQQRKSVKKFLQQPDKHNICLKDVLIFNTDGSNHINQTLPATDLIGLELINNASNFQAPNDKDNTDDYNEQHDLVAKNLNNVCINNISDNTQTFPPDLIKSVALLVKQNPDNKNFNDLTLNSRKRLFAKEILSLIASHRTLKLSYQGPSGNTSNEIIKIIYSLEKIARSLLNDAILKDYLEERNGISINQPIDNKLKLYIKQRNLIVKDLEEFCGHRRVKNKYYLNNPEILAEKIISLASNNPKNIPFSTKPLNEQKQLCAKEIMDIIELYKKHKPFSRIPKGIKLLYNSAHNLQKQPDKYIFFEKWIADFTQTPSSPSTPS